MAIKIYNTMTGRKDEFIPIKDGHVGMYVCGVTVYDISHIGHARAVVVFDVIYRYLQYKGFRVTYVRNLTDVDDKIIKKANELGVSCKDVSEKYISEFYMDMKPLGVLKPTYEPKATEHIKDMIALINTLVKKGYGYEVDGDVFYSVEKFKNYGRLSKRNIEEMEAGARVEIDERKRNPMDFALWKKSKPGEPSWESPWGQGRPGWHIECSAMSIKYLGESFDIHGGGSDLIFPHHENEIVQSESVTGKRFANYWIHNGMIYIDKEKMSKSLRNFFTVREVLQNTHPEVLRFFLLSNHYRSPIDFSDENILNAKNALDRYYTTLDMMDEFDLQDKKIEALEGVEMNGLEREAFLSSSNLLKEFESAMNDDFNTALAIGHVFKLIRVLNQYLAQMNKQKSELHGYILKQVRSSLGKIGSVLGVFNSNPKEYFVFHKERGVRLIDISRDEVEGLIMERNKARESEDWKKADDIRSQLLERGIILEDKSNGTIWRWKS